MEVILDNRELQSKLKDFLQDKLPEAIEQGLERACLVVEKEAKQKCPVDDGQLRQSITHTVKNGEGIIGSNVEYAPYVEIGTGIYSSEGTGRRTPWTYQDAKGEFHTTKGQKPQPFLRPALEENTKKILDCFEGLIK